MTRAGPSESGDSLVEELLAKWIACEEAEKDEFVSRVRAEHPESARRLERLTEHLRESGMLDAPEFPRRNPIAWVHSGCSESSGPGAWESCGSPRRKA
ncbi:MAG: hypothetical protein Fur0037_20350 [Planctomycetota bacterium]